MKRIVVNVGIAVALLAACKHKTNADKPRCTTCPHVAGTYAQTWQSLSVEQVSGSGGVACQNIYVNSGSNAVVVQQAEGSSDLTIHTGLIFDAEQMEKDLPLSGVLHDDFSVTSNTQPSFLSDAAVPYNVAIDAKFQVASGQATGLTGNYIVTQNCEVDLPISWTLQ